MSDLKLAMEALGDAATIERYPDRASWLAARTQGIGASDLAVVLGLLPFGRSQLQLYAEKIGLGASDPALSEEAEWGLILEPAVADRYRKVTGRQVLDLGAFTILRSRAHPWLTASLDRLAYDDDVERFMGPLELKTTSAFKKEDWSEEPPLAYQVQLQAQMVVTALVRGSLACLIGGQRFVYADMERHADFQELLLEKGLEFWSRVQERREPPADASESSRAILQALYPKPTPGQVITLPAEAAVWETEILDAEKEKKRAEEVIEGRRNLLRQAIGSAEAGLVLGGSVWTLKSVSRKQYDIPEAVKAEYLTAPLVYRELRRKTTKGGNA